MADIGIFFWETNKQFLLPTACLNIPRNVFRSISIIEHCCLLQKFQQSQTPVKALYHSAKFWGLTHQIVGIYKAGAFYCLGGNTLVMADDLDLCLES
ncbi:MAG: hypothetical protein CL912_18835 [Deltaproteobacteria bacterium]|nr:hypothetical protein [Deltaproteobacteria bacterium]|tara:strand:+ start:246 stop:536 length:291 start_codon:yes stop_codon:yes gene_type:complete